MRRQNDFYPTPTWATDWLVRLVGIGGTVLEPCVGEGHISHTLERYGLEVSTNDIDLKMPAHFHEDALGDDFLIRWKVDWIVSNPPFNIADQVVPRFLSMAEWGVAVLLRLSWLEPTQARAAFLEANPPTSLIVLPRISFTGDGKSDSVTTAWFVWDRKELHDRQRIIVVPKRALEPPLPIFREQAEQPVLLEASS